MVHSKIPITKTAVSITCKVLFAHSLEMMMMFFKCQKLKNPLTTEQIIILSIISETDFRHVEGFLPL